ncbi:MULTISPECIES: low molecular weight protein-tyrosine-phosphatase [Sphingobacterium]|nr:MULTISPECIES: low molecular weight protein-tyrosine-phosphatase [Sphingobacterium]MBA8985463.1 protein-tyrosine phosphatase [Sphingobacterium soli]OYD41645.1 protein tyrosine phosphatase [Sphingobacterium cellulitidis]OYD45790.1 protein tyrosine phosphatase [Sphingobacterium cellulitidis]WFB63884.1 low molecular weight phosphotyrosine protein phosphatase [Sphingobacterium sp. WM]
MKILMVCLGNICRSPLAHGIMEHMVAENGLSWEIDSAGTGDWHVGHAPDKRSIQVAKDRGIDISNQRAQLFEPNFFSKYDRILVMDKQNYADVTSMATSQEDLNKVSLFLTDDIVPDPYYDSNMFVPVFELIESRCKELIKNWS